MVYTAKLNAIYFVIFSGEREINHRLFIWMFERAGDSGVLGKVGTELYAEAVCSAVFPNSLGICIKTKVSVYYFWGYLVVIICFLSCNIRGSIKKYEDFCHFYVICNVI